MVLTKKKKKNAHYFVPTHNVLFETILTFLFESCGQIGIILSYQENNKLKQK